MNNASPHSATATRTLDCAWLLADPGSERARADMRVVVEDGRVASVSAWSAPAAGRRRLLMPALSNAHDHARTFRSATLGAYDQPLESWLPYLGVLPGVDAYLCAATSFARSVRQGVTQLMVHYTRVQGLGSYVDEVRAVARAANDVGVRVGFAVAMRDRQGMAYCEDETVIAALRPGIRDAVRQRLGVRALPPAQHLAMVDEAAQMVREEGHAGYVNLQYGPAAVQWCSQLLLEAVARASADTGRGVHMHLLETKYQRTWADQVHPLGIVKYLDDIGLLSPRLTLAHCTWARADELALLAERGVTIAVNTSSNLGLRSGIAPLPAMLKAGCRVAMGLDGMAFDEDDDALREMRLGWSLHRGWGFDQDMSVADLWTFAARNGKRCVSGMSGGTARAVERAAAGGKASDGDCERDARIVPGATADLLLLDWDAVDDDALFPDVEPMDLLLARVSGAHIDEVIARGRCVVEKGRVTGIDESALRAELIARTRAALAVQPESVEWRERVHALAEDLRPFYRDQLFGCC